MKTLVSMVLLLAPLQPVHAALVFESDGCCAVDSRPEQAGSDADALNNRGSQYYTAGDYANAQRTLEAALTVRQAEANPNLASMASTLFNLAALARMQARLPEAEALYKRSIAIREAVSGPGSPDLGHALAGLALVYMSEGHLAQATELAQRAVSVSQQRSEDLAQLAAANNTLATLLMAQGDNAKAEGLELQVAGQLKLGNATGMQEYVTALTNLGTSRLRQSNYRQAELDFRDAEAAALKVAGPEHPLTATIWNNLAKVRAAQGDWKTASAFFTRAIAVWRKTLGPNHPDIALGLTNIAALDQSRKRYFEAERLYRQALEIDEAAFGADSLRVANDWNNLGALSALQHHDSEAEARLSKGFSIAERKVGADHPDTAQLAVNLAVVYVSQSRYAEASVLFAKALPVEERVLGHDSPGLASILRLYAASLKADRNYVAAERAELQATRITTHNSL